MVPAHLTLSLAKAANTAINGVLLTGATHAGQSPPTGEVGFVAAVVIGGVPALANAWNPILNPTGYSAQIHGVFCHQSPLVNFTDASGAPKRCELADLLVVVDDLTGSTPARRWAVLVQAKMAAGGGTTLTSLGELAQLDLLSRWPKFTLPTTFSPGWRDFSTCWHAGSVLDCGRYGLIDPLPTPTWRQEAPATSMLTTGMELGGFLAHMIETGQTGYGREATGVADDWSLTVDELLKITGASTFTYARGFKSPRPRGVAALAHFGPYLIDGPQISGSWVISPPPSGGRPERVDDELPGEGISFLHIGIKQA